MKKFNIIYLMIAVIAISAAFTSCDKNKEAEKEPPTKPLPNEKGVVINGIKWSTRNVAAPGTFAAKPEDAGMLYRWNRKKAWNTTDSLVSGWDSTIPEGDSWAKANDPCPTGWRVPTQEELESLLSAISVVSGPLDELNGVTGRYFGSGDEKLFLPAAGYRDDCTGTLLNAGSFGYYWSSTANSSEDAYSLAFVSGYDAGVYGEGSRSFGFSVRCVSELSD